MKISIRSFFVFLSLSLLAPASQAAFPDDLDNVIIQAPADARVKGFAVTANLQVAVTSGPVDSFGRRIDLVSDKRSVWPGNQFGLNANAWLFAEFDGVWYAATWEWMRVGATARSEGAVIFERHLLTPIFRNFRLRQGQVYGFMVAGTTRGGTSITAAERSNVAFYRWGVGPVDASEIFGTTPAATSAMPGPAVDLLLNDDE